MTSLEGNDIQLKSLNTILATLILGLIVLAGFTIQSSSIRNQVARKELVTSQYTTHSTIVIDQNSDFDDLGFPGTGQENDPYIISNLNISSQTGAIIISQTNVSFIIRDCLLSGTQGIQLTEVSNGSVEGCIITAVERGISIFSSESISIDNTEIRGAQIGVVGYRFSFSTLESCKFHHNYYGINISNGSFNDISYCDIFSNTGAGIYLEGQTRNFTIFSNSIGWNGITSASNAIDNGQFNEWTSNRWSDYTNEGEAYVIVGNASAQDQFASVLSDTTIPIVDGSDDIRYDEGETGYTVHWNATDDFLDGYEIWIDDNLVDSGISWGDKLEYSVDGLTIGSHNITAIFFDASGNSASEDIWVIVLLSIFGGEGTVLIFYGSLLSVGAVLVMIVILKQMR